MTSKAKYQQILVSFLLIWGMVAHADIISLTSADSGYITRNGNDFSLTTGSGRAERTNSLDSNAYYVFDLSSVSGSILDASINLSGTTDGAPNLSLYQVDTDYNTLTDANSDLRSIHSDLDSSAYSSSSNGGSVTLNSTAVTDIINAGNGLFIIGLDNSSNRSWFQNNSLVLTLTTATPEASEIILMILGILLLYKFYSDQKKKTELPSC